MRNKLNVYKAYTRKVKCKTGRDPLSKERRAGRDEKKNKTSILMSRKPKDFLLHLESNIFSTTFNQSKK